MPPWAGSEPPDHPNDPLIDAALQDLATLVGAAQRMRASLVELLGGDLARSLRGDVRTQATAVRQLCEVLGPQAEHLAGLLSPNNEPRAD